MRFNIRAKLIIAFILAIIIPLGCFIGFYFLSIKLVVNNTHAKIALPEFSREVSGRIESNYIKTGDLREASSALVDVKLPPGGRIEVLGTGGEVVYDTLGVSAGSNVKVSELAVKVSSAFKPNENEGELIDYVVAPLTAGGADIGAIMVSFPRKVATEPIYRYLKFSLAAGVVIAALVIFVLGWLLSRGIVAPLNKLLAATEKISLGDFEAGVYVDSKDELGRLGKAFNSMVEELKKSREREQALELSRRELVANVSHDLRTPLSSIRGYVEGLLDGVAAEPEKARRYLGVIHEKALSLERLINDLFELSRLEAGQLKMDFVEVNVGDMLRELCDIFSRDAAMAGLNFTYRPQGALPVITVDPGKIEQVLANLIQNSIRHTGAGGFVSVRAEAVGGEVLVSVQDNGEGIASEDLPQVFNRLYTGEKSRSRARSGTGLGLAIAREIIQAHGGRIWAESQKNHGSAFYFALPARK